ncbi:MAG: MBL fold metallo-hydrolase [Gemmatimonadales bacterium]|nr:MBL fold metallo-hydrolase [Gemmatimonadales bacterium]
MLFKRLYDTRLAQASYLIGSQRAGEAIVVDPNRDIGGYLSAADAEGLRIAHVVETHIHADFVSGSRELARRTGAALHLSSEGGEAWQYGYAAEDGAVLLRDGDTIQAGDVRLDAVHTPGHTPEHLSFLVTDTTAAADLPLGFLTGDFLFVSDVGRPDLLERAAGLAGSAEAGARALFHSIRQLGDLPDHLQVWPGHGAGSACGKSLGAMPQTTLGYERLTNWAFAILDEEAFVRAALAGQPEAPRYFARMKRINRDGPRSLNGVPEAPRLPSPALPPAIDRGALIVDARAAAEFARGHVPGAVSIPRNAAFTTWAGWLIPDDRDFYLILGRDEVPDAAGVLRDLAMIGLDRAAGWFGPDAVEGWAATGRALERVRKIAPDELLAVTRRPESGTGGGEVTVLDVRSRAEWEAGHVPGSLNVPVGELTERAGELPRDGTLVVHCQGGTRSGIAAGVLQSFGFRNVTDLASGFTGWQRAGGPVEQDQLP